MAQSAHNCERGVNKAAISRTFIRKLNEIRGRQLRTGEPQDGLLEWHLDRNLVEAAEDSKQNEVN